MYTVQKCIFGFFEFLHLIDDEQFDSSILKTFIINVIFTIRYYFGEKDNHLTVSLNEIKEIHANKK